MINLRELLLSLFELADQAGNNDLPAVMAALNAKHGDSVQVLLQATLSDCLQELRVGDLLAIIAKKV